MSLRSSSQQPPGKYVKCDRLQRESNPSRRTCYLHAVALDHVADEMRFFNFAHLSQNNYKLITKKNLPGESSILPQSWQNNSKDSFRLLA